MVCLVGLNLVFFVVIGCFFYDIGLSVLQVCGLNLKDGFLLFEDLGDDFFVWVLEGGGDQQFVYEMVIDVLLYLYV